MTRKSLRSWVGSALVGLVLVACGPNPDGDVAAGEEAAKKSPPVTKVEDLPKDMSPEMRAAAENAIRQQEAQRKFAEEQAAKGGAPKTN